MAATYRRLLGAALAAALLLAGCAGAPPPPPRPEPVAPLPPVSRNPREVALERALGEFSGAPYVSGGTTPAGVDCSGLIQALYQRAGLTPAPHRGRPVPGRPAGGAQRTPIRRRGLLQPLLPDPGPGSDPGRHPLPGVDEDEVCHDGIYLGGGRFMHASPRGVFISRLDAEVWRVSYRGARRYLPGGN